jgi:hypothetical protein
MQRRNMSTYKLSEKLPEIADFIDRTLLKHEKDAHPVSSAGFKRLPLYFSESLLNRAKFVVVDEIPFPLKELGDSLPANFDIKKFVGITYKDTFFVIRNYEKNESTYFHELIHVIQWDSLGFDRFLRRYLEEVDTFEYCGSPLERMAYAFESWFDRGAVDQNVEIVVRNLLTQMQP